MLGKELVLTDSVQFMNSRYESLLKKLPKHKFRICFKKFSGKGNLLMLLYE